MRMYMFPHPTTHLPHVYTWSHVTFYAAEIKVYDESIVSPMYMPIRGDNQEAEYEDVTGQMPTHADVPMVDNPAYLAYKHVKN